MTATQQDRPIWQTEPCPWWCDRGHRDGDHVEDRRCSGTIDEIPMALAPAVEMAPAGDYQLATLKVIVQPHSSTGQMTVHIYNDDEQHMWFDLLPNEAGDLIVALERARSAATGGERG